MNSRKSDVSPHKTRYGDENKAENEPRPFPHPAHPYCKRYGWAVSRGGWVRLREDVAVTLGHPTNWHLRKLLDAAGVTARRGNWRGEMLEAIPYRHALRLVEMVNGGRGPPEIATGAEL